MQEVDLTTRVANARLAYENAGREITQAFEVINSNTSLGAGILAVLLSVLGIGDLTTQQAGALPRFSSVSLLVLAAALPLVFRFYMRSMLGYMSLLRFNLIQRAAWDYLNGSITWDEFAFLERLHGDTRVWRSPIGLTKLFMSSLRYGFLWVFLIYGSTVAWGFYTEGNSRSAWTAVVILVVGCGIEVGFLLRGRSYFFKTPTADEKAELLEIRARSALASDHASATDPPELVAESSGFFLGRHRFWWSKRP